MSNAASTNASTRPSSPPTARCWCWPGPAAARRACSPTRIAHLIRDARRRRPAAPGLHLHEQGGARDARAASRECWEDRPPTAGWGPSTPPGCASCGVTAARLGWQSHFAIYDTEDSEALLKAACSQRPHRRPARESPGKPAAVISRWKNDRMAPEAALGAAGDARERLLAEVYAELPAAAAPPQRLRFRRSHPAAGGALRGAPGGAARLRARASSTSWWTSSRTPTPCRWLHRDARERARQPLRGRRRRPVHLRLAWGAHREHPASSRPLPGHPARDPAGAELPIDTDHPRRGQPGHREQRRPQGQEPVDRRSPSATRSG